MLILSRKIGEKIIMTLPDGRTVEVQVMQIDRGKTRLGIVAPRDVPIYRKELLEKPQCDTKTSSK